MCSHIGRFKNLWIQKQKCRGNWWQLIYRYLLTHYISNQFVSYQCDRHLSLLFSVLDEHHKKNATVKSFLVFCFFFYRLPFSTTSSLVFVFTIHVEMQSWSCLDVPTGLVEHPKQSRVIWNRLPQNVRHCWTKYKDILVVWSVYGSL